MNTDLANEGEGQNDSSQKAWITTNQEAKITTNQKAEITTNQEARIIIKEFKVYANEACHVNQPGN